MSGVSIQKSVTVPWVRAQKGVAQLTMLTAYDYPTAARLDQAGIDLILIGDSVATVLYGEPNTLSVTIEDMIRHTTAVARGAQRALVVADMPFMSYQVSIEEAVRNAGRLIKEARAQAVKLEGGTEVAATIRAITRAGIPVVAHLGLTPQSIHAMGHYRMHGKSEAERTYLLESAQAVTQAGAFAAVLECVQPELAREITAAIAIPTIGIGSGMSCDGQVLVTNDLVGLTLGKVPRFVEPLADLQEPFVRAVAGYIARVRGQGPTERPESPQHSGAVQHSGAAQQPAFPSPNGPQEAPLARGP
jgi:3-methyl-2-oxobutanoate hydroxymethyltransferase